jgi:predicted transcriptional regulator
VERVLQACDHHLPDLEGGPADGSAGPPPGPEAAGEGPAALPPDLSPAGRGRLEAWRALYAADAAALPLAPFAAAWGETGDPVAVAHRFGTDVAAVLRRVAALPPAPDRPAAGLAIADAAGALMHFKGIEGFSLPRAGAGCPVWPLYEALGQPGRPLRAIASMPGEGGARFLCHAVATLAPPAHFDAPPVVRATMLVLPGAAAPEGLPERPVGPSCRICPRESCPARREPAVLG